MLTSSDHQRGVILDRKHSIALLNSVENKGDYIPRLTTEKEQALLSLVIFETAEIVESATIGKEKSAERLISEAIVQYVPRSVFQEPMKFVDSYTRNLATRDSGYALIEDGFPTEEATTIAAQEKSVEVYLPFIRANSNSLNELSWADLKKSFLEHYIAFPPTELTFELGRELGIYENVDKYGLPTMDDFVVGAADLDDAARGWDHKRKIDNQYRDFLKLSNTVVAETVSAYIEYRGLVRRARISGYPIKSKCSMTETHIDRTLGPEAMQLFKLHLDEVRVIPYLSSIEDVFRLRGHKHIKNFRSSILEWLDRIADGETRIEEKYRAAIKTANSELKKLERWKFVSSPYTLAVSLTIGTVELFTGTPFGLLISAISAVALADRVTKERKYGYVVFPT